MKVFYLNFIFYPVFFTLAAISVIVFSIFLILIRPFAGKRKVLYLLRHIIKLNLRFTVGVLPLGFIKILYKDYEKKEPSRGSVFICNHRATSDALLAAILPSELVQVVNIWPFKIPVFGLIAKWAGYLSIREMAFEEFLQRGQKLLKDGVSIVMFPEGTRSASKKMGKFHGSIFRLALKTGCPIIPVCITGNENIPPRGTLFLRPGEIKIHKLKALHHQDYKDLTPFKLKNKVRDIMAEHLLTME